MRDSLFHLERLGVITLQAQLRQKLVSAMLNGEMPVGSPLPSTRAMAKRLRVSRNTVMLTYQGLASDGYLEPRERSGFYVSSRMPGKSDLICEVNAGKFEGIAGPVTDWHEKLRLTPSGQDNIVKPANWHELPYPFIYGQADSSLFPITAWRDCMRQAMSVRWLDEWTDDRFAEDDPMLIEQIRQRILPRRGVSAEPDEILVTMGAQNALYMLAHLLIGQDTTVGVENPGYPDIRNIVSLRSNKIRPIGVDQDGLITGETLESCDIVFVTPSHQFPTNAKMPMARRRELLNWAARKNTLVVEDDYEFETNYVGEPTPALKSIDRNGRVIYVGSLSKSLMPGLRMGFLVAPAPLIKEARALRKQILRHPPSNNQRVVALFLAQGHHDTLTSRLHRAYHQRWQIMGEALDRYFPGWARTPGFGGTSYWISGPNWLDSEILASAALDEGIVIEPGHICFSQPEGNRNHFRMGFSSISEDRITPGIEHLRQIVDRMIRGR